MPPSLVILVPLAALALADWWVYSDASSRQGTSRQVGVTIGELEIATPQIWLALCLVLFVLAFPLYLVARRAAG